MQTIQGIRCQYKGSCTVGTAVATTTSRCNCNCRVVGANATQNSVKQALEKSAANSVVRSFFHDAQFTKFPAGRNGHGMRQVNARKGELLPSCLKEFKGEAVHCVQSVVQNGTGGKKLGEIGLEMAKYCGSGVGIGGHELWMLGGGRWRMPGWECF